MNSYEGMTMVKKNRDKMTLSNSKAYFSPYQPIHISPLIIDMFFITCLHVLYFLLKFYVDL